MLRIDMNGHNKRSAFCRHRLAKTPGTADAHKLTLRIQRHVDYLNQAALVNVFTISRRAKPIVSYVNVQAHLLFQIIG